MDEGNTHFGLADCSALDVKRTQRAEHRAEALSDANKQCDDEQRAPHALVHFQEIRKNADDRHNQRDIKEDFLGQVRVDAAKHVVETRQREVGGLGLGLLIGRQ